MSPIAVILTLDSIDSSGPSNIIAMQQKTNTAAKTVTTHTAFPTNDAVTAAADRAVHAPGRIPVLAAPSITSSLKQMPANAAMIKAKSQWGEYFVIRTTAGTPINA